MPAAMPASAPCGGGSRAHAALILVPALGCVVLAASACAPPPARPPAVREAYVRYCASCHGENGGGDGPLAVELRTRPTDLTRLAARPGGFDDVEIMKAIDGRRHVAAHGPREMPVWGAVFRDSVEAADGRYAGYTALLTARALTDFLRSIQADATPTPDPQP